MQREIMIAVDDSRHSKIAVDYAVNIHQAVQDVKFTLMHVQPTISQYLLDDAKTNSQAYAELEKLNRKTLLKSSTIKQRVKQSLLRRLDKTRCGQRNFINTIIRATSYPPAV